MIDYDELLQKTAALTGEEIKSICDEWTMTEKSLFPRWIYACFLPLGYLAENILLEQPGAALLSEKARRKLREIIVDRLTFLGHSVCLKLIVEQERRRENENKETRMEDISRYMAEAGYRRIHDEYPVLSDKLKVSILDFVNMNTVFFKHLVIDWEDIQSFCDAPNRVVALFQEMKELHPSDKNVHILTFDNGRKIVYKKDTFKQHEGWNEWCKELKQFLELDIRVPAQMIRQDHVWQEYISYKEVSSEKEAAEYYKRTGELLCVLYFMNAKDIQAENMIADGKYPVLIDIETIINSHNTDRQVSVKDSYCLPGCQSLKYVNRDMAALAWEEGRTSIPSFKKKPYLVQDYKQELAEGFESAYKAFQRQKVFLHPEQCFSHTTFRVVLRPTWLYLWMMDQDYSRWKLLEEEKQMLQKGYVPVFHQKWESKNLCFDNAVLKKNYFKETPAETVIIQLHRMNDADLKEQLRIILECCSKMEEQS